MTKEALSIYDTLKLALEALIWADAKGENWEKVVSKAIRVAQEALSSPNGEAQRKPLTDFLHEYARLTADSYTDEKDGDVVYSFYGGDLESFCDLIQTHGIKENT